MSRSPRRREFIIDSVVSLTSGGGWLDTIDKAHPPPQPSRLSLRRVSAAIMAAPSGYYVSLFSVQFEKQRSERANNPPSWNL